MSRFEFLKPKLLAKAWIAIENTTNTFFGIFAFCQKFWPESQLKIKLVTPIFWSIRSDAKIEVINTTAY
jgi:hypothetical protein